MRKVNRDFLQGHVLDRMKGNGFKLRKSRFILVIIKKFFTVRLPSKVVNAPFLEEFKASKHNIFFSKPNFSDILLFRRRRKSIIFSLRL